MQNMNPAMQQQRLHFVTTNVPGLSYGLGIFRLGPFLGHDGEVAGYDAIMLYSPSQHQGMIVLGTADPDLDLPAPAAKVTALQVAQDIYPIAFPGQTPLGATGTG